MPSDEKTPGIHLFGVFFYIYSTVNEYKSTYNVGDLVQIIHIGEGTEEAPWTEVPVAGIYLGTVQDSYYKYDRGDNLSKKIHDHTTHIVWYKGRKRHVLNAGDIKLLAPAHN